MLDAVAMDVAAAVLSTVAGPMAVADLTDAECSMAAADVTDAEGSMAAAGAEPMDVGVACRKERAGEAVADSRLRREDVSKN